MSCLRVGKDGHLTILTLVRPEKMNALGELGDGAEFARVCDDINADKSVRCVILTGEGRAFSAGGDLKAMLNREGAFKGDINQLRDNYRTGIHRIIKSLWGIEVPVIAAINGPAIGLGNDLATTADIRVASEEAKFAATFINIGLVPGDGGAWLLPRAIGSSRAAELFFTGDTIDAQTALQWGLVSSIHPKDKVMEKALEIASKIVAKPPLPVRLTKQMMRQANNVSLETILEMACSMQAAMHQTKDHAEAVTAMLNKSEATYTGE